MAGKRLTKDQRRRIVTARKAAKSGDVEARKDLRALTRR